MFKTFASKNVILSYFRAMKKAESKYTATPNEATRQAFLNAYANYNAMKKAYSKKEA